jgi:hypothetical protein
VRLTRLAGRAALAALGAAAWISSAAPAHAQKELKAYVQPALRDVSVRAEVLSKSDPELEKLGKGFVDAYRLSGQEVICKEPNRVRFQGKNGAFIIRYVTNGTRKLTEVPTLRIHSVDDISKEPAKGDSVSDLGLITAAWVDRVEDRWLRSESRDGKELQVFEFWYKEDPKYRHTIWVDPGTKTIVEHIAHHRNPNKPGFKKRFVYSEAKQFSGVWVPTKATLYNPENKAAASMKYDDIRVNTSPADKLFDF